MSPIAQTPKPPYYAVIFTSVLRPGNQQEYALLAAELLELAQGYDGFLGRETSPRDEAGMGLGLSYWRELASIQAWKEDLKHLAAQRKGQGEWFAAYKVRVALVERDYGFAG